MYGRFGKLYRRSPIALAALVGVISVGVISVGFAAAPARAAVTLPPRVSVVARRGGKLSPRLSVLEQEPSFASPRAAARNLSLPTSGAGTLVDAPDGRVMVEIRTADPSAAGVAELRALGARVVNVSPAYDTVTAAVAPDALAAIASDTDVTYVHEVLAPITSAVGKPSAAGALDPHDVRCHPTVSEGDSLMNVAAARAQNDVDGTGQTIGVLSDSFNTDASAETNATYDISTGDLPGALNPCGYKTPVKVQEDYSGGGQEDEGRAMIELAHGLAPRANLAFATAANGDLDMANQIAKLRTTNHASVIVDDAAYLDEPFFQDGPVANAANAASAAGVPYFSAAGNQNVVVGGNNVSSYEAPSFRTTTCPIAVIAFDAYTGCHNFDTSGPADNTDGITIGVNGGVGIDLQWAQPWGAVTNDYDLFILNASGTSVLAYSNLDQSGLQEPVEFAGYTNSTGSPQTVQVVIAKFSGGTDSRLKFVMIGASRVNAVEHNVSDGTDIVGPSILGHNGAASVGSTAAIPYNNSNQPEDYSSRGPVTQYYEPTPSTTALGAPLVLAKPDFAATDNVKNVFFATPAGGGVFRFAGTSAAAPQAAAIAALLREYDSALTPAEVMSTLRTTARAVTTNGTADDVGGGYLDALAALASVAPPPRTPTLLSEANGNASVTLQWSTRAGNTYPVTSNEITPYLNGVAQPSQFNSGATTQVIGGLTNGGSYQFTIQASNANGPGPVSALTAPIIVGQPGKPGSVGAVGGNARATVSWKKPTVTYGIPITGYDVGALINNKQVAHHVFRASATKGIITGLTNAKKYAFAVTALNASSVGVRSGLTPVIAIGLPGAPKHVGRKVGPHGVVTVVWKAAAANGPKILAYVVTTFSAGRAVHTTKVRAKARSLVVKGLVAGKTYSFGVTARNAAGAGPPSTRSKPITITPS